jgi:hypothetical protein
VHFAVTAHPTMAWVIQQLREAMPFGQQPSYLFRDNEGIYGDEVGRFLVATGIAEVKTAHRCPCQNPFVERYGGTGCPEKYAASAAGAFFYLTSPFIGQCYAASSYLVDFEVERCFR